MAEPDPTQFLPLTSRVFHILLALADEPANGYRITVRAEESSGGLISLSPGTLYENIHRLAGQGLIREITGERGHRPDGRGQRYYELTGLGRAVLRAEVERLRADLRAARVLDGRSGAEGR